MALVLETGAIVANAEAYVAAVEVVAYAAKRSVTLTSVTDAHVESLIVKAMDLLESLESRIQGTRVSSEQVLSWPRANVSLNGFDVLETTIPAVLKKALCQLAVDADGFDLMPTGDGREVIKEKVDVLETTYAATGAAVPPPPTLTAFYNILAPLLASGGAFTLELER